MFSVRSIATMLAATAVVAALGSVARGALVGYWPLDGNAVAAVGTDGVLVNGPTPAADRFGNPSGALSFDGALEQYLSVDGGGGLNGATEGTISMFVRWLGPQDSSCCGSYGNVLARQSNTVFSDDVIGLNGTNPSLAALTWQANDAGAPDITGTTAVGSGVWRHVAVTFSPTGHKVYLDGRQEGPTVAGGELHDNAAIPLAIGAWNGDGGGYSTAVIDDVKIFDAALSQAEVQAVAGFVPVTITVDSNATDWRRSTTVLSYDGDSWTGLDAADLPPTATYTEAVVTDTPPHIVSAANLLGVTAIDRGIGDGIGFYRRTFDLPDFESVSANLALAVDNFGQIYVNGIEVASELSFSTENWAAPLPSFSIGADGTTTNVIKFDEVLANFSGWQVGQNELVIVDKQRVGGGFAFRMDLLVTPAAVTVPEPSGFLLAVLGLLGLGLLGGSRAAAKSAGP